MISENIIMRYIAGQRFRAFLGAAAILVWPTVTTGTWIDWRSKDNLAVVQATGIEKDYVLTALG
jgi:hypothetical protein